MIDRSFRVGPALALTLTLGIGAVLTRQARAETPRTATVAPASEPAAANKASIPPGFERVAGAPETEKIDPNPLVVAAYAAIFVGLFGYMIHVARSQAQIAKEMAELRERIRRVEKP